MTARHALSFVVCCVQVTPLGEVNAPLLPGKASPTATKIPNSRAQTTPNNGGPGDGVVRCVQFIPSGEVIILVVVVACETTTNKDNSGDQVI